MTRLLPKIVLLTLALATLGIAGDGPTAVAPAAKRARSRSIAEGAIKVPVPAIEQPDDYSCGAAALLSVCSYYGVGPRKLARLKRELRTDPVQGTDYHNMIRYAESLGLEVRWKAAMTTEELDEHLRQGRPVICSIQAYSDDPMAYNDPRYNRDGHYVVAIGLDRDNYFFMDPSLRRRRGFLPRAEFVQRWHDNEGTEEEPRIIEHLGIAIFAGAGRTPYVQSARRIE
jgi:predicted double-glycine peptidase